MRPQTFTHVPSTRKPLSLRLRLQAGADEPRPNVGEVQKNHPNPAQPCANSSKSCIKRASAAKSASADLTLTLWLARGRARLPNALISRDWLLIALENHPMWFWSWETLATARRVSREVAIAILSDDMEALFYCANG